MEKYTDEMLIRIEDLKKTAAFNRQEKSLRKLSKAFNNWKSKKLDSNGLSAQIREWYLLNVENSGFTTGSDPGLPIAKALSEGDLKKKDISEDLYLKLEMLIQIMKV